MCVFGPHSNIITNKTDSQTMCFLIELFKSQLNVYCDYLFPNVKEAKQFVERSEARIQDELLREYTQAELAT